MSEGGDAFSDWPAPAKLNLFLRIVGRRADGYHELQTAFQLLDWGDTVRLRPRSDAQLRLLRGAPGVTADQDLVLRAARLLQSQMEVPLGADLWVEKRIPSGAGLGGGSSDAASVLVGLDALWGLGLGEDRLAELGLRLGADVPVFVRGRSAWAEGVGERLQPLALPQRWFLLLLPEAHVATAELFQAPELTRNAPRATIQGFVSQEATDNAFTPLVRSRVPAVDEALQQLQRFGLARMSGTGSACFAAFASREEAEAAAEVCADRFRTQVAMGLDHSPLLAARDRFLTGAAAR
jgi:4-diphosphocytidyl-2-C-methyl-D-erythritol kinase